MSVKSYLAPDGTKFYEVYICVRSPHGGKLQRRLRGITSFQKAKLQEFELKRKLCVTQSWCSKAGFGPTKCARNRVVPISSELGRFLKEIRLRNKPGYEFVLPHLPNGPLAAKLSS